MATLASALVEETDRETDADDAHDEGVSLHLGGLHFDDHAALHEAIAVELAEDRLAASDQSKVQAEDEDSSDDAPQEELEAFDPENPKRARSMRRSMPAARYRHPGGDDDVPAADLFIGFKHPHGTKPGSAKPPLIVRALARLANHVNHGFNLDEMRLRMDGMHNLQAAEGVGKGLYVHRNVTYKEGEQKDSCSEWKHQLDVYLPAGPRAQLKMIVHFHGGGWRRGDRQAEFQGAPAISRAYALAGFVCFTPSYRLGKHTEYAEDSRDAVLWALKHAKRYGADPAQVFLSGHSAGGNIATLLAVSGEWLPPAAHNVLKGVIGLSGVYSVLNPLGGAFSTRKNKTYDKIFRTAVFGDDLAVLSRHSPTALLRLSLGEKEPFPKNECQMCKLTRHLLHFSNDGGEEQSTSAPVAVLEANGTVSAGPEGCKWRNGPLPAFLLLNAEADVGLETDGARMSALLEQRRARDGGVAPEYHIVKDTNHTTLAWDIFGALPLAVEFIRKTDGTC